MGECQLLVVVNLSAKNTLPIAVLQEIDSALGKVGLRKQVRSVLVAGSEFSTTYEGPNASKEQLTDILLPITKQNDTTFTIDIEESVSFP
ncbi:MAG TPA: hypothetical protein VLV18_05380 [Terriglobales bacterium]|nr:hypothetical protein [Terriglobales bacterium]